jgi:hypothetical protein
MARFHYRNYRVFFCVSQQEGSRGAAKILLDGPPAHLIKPKPTHLPSDFFPLISFSTFLGVSRQGELKNTTQIFLQKVHVENFFKIKKIDASFSSILFLFYRVFGCFSARGVQKHHKKRFTKKIVSVCTE